MFPRIKKYYVLKFFLAELGLHCGTGPSLAGKFSTTRQTGKSLYVLVDCLFSILDCQLQGAGSLAHSLLYCLSLEQAPGMGALSICVLKENDRPCSFHLHSLHLVPQISPPLAREISGLVLGDQLLASGQGGQKPQQCRGQNNVCGRDDLPQASALGFSFSFLKAGKAIFWPEHHVVLLRRFLQRRVTASVAAFLGKGKEPSKRGQDRLRKGNSAIGRAGRRGGQQDPPRGRKSLRGGGRGGEPPAAPAL